MSGTDAFGSDLGRSRWDWVGGIGTTGTEVVSEEEAG